MLPSISPIQHNEIFTIRTYEIDSQKRITAPALIKLMHEAAMQNVIKIRLSVWDLEPHHISWVLMRKVLRIDRLPMLGEKITVVTNPSGFEKFFTYRDYRVYDESETLIAQSSSTWLLMDTQKRRMARIPDFILKMNDQMPKPEDCLPRPQGKIPKLEQSDRQKNYEVNWFDLDFNQHLNNTYFIQWMLEALDKQLLSQGMLKELEIVYKQEAQWQEQVLSEVQALGNGRYLHRLTRASDGKEMASAFSGWGVG